MCILGLPGNTFSSANESSIKLHVCLLSVNHDQFLRQLKENGMHKNVPFNIRLEILSREYLQSKLRCSKNGNLKYDSSNKEEDKHVHQSAVKPKNE